MISCRLNRAPRWQIPYFESSGRMCSRDPAFRAPWFPALLLSPSKRRRFVVSQPSVESRTPTCNIKASRDFSHFCVPSMFSPIKELTIPSLRHSTTIFDSLALECLSLRCSLWDNSTSSLCCLWKKLLPFLSPLKDNLRKNGLWLGFGDTASPSCSE